MRIISHKDSPRAAARELHELLKSMGRRRSLRDPLLGAIEKTGFTPAQVHVLAWLGSDGPLPMSELARRLGITEKTMTGVVDRLERKKHVTRERDTQDRRVVRVRLTAQGLKVARVTERHLLAALERLMSLLAAPERADFLRVMHKLLERLAANPSTPRTLRP
ncbi:MAG: MarR family winged helix-turn-helix transcriptional regulator [Myxococcota bacterium]